MNSSLKSALALWKSGRKGRAYRVVARAMRTSVSEEVMLDLLGLRDKN